MLGGHLGQEQSAAGASRNHNPVGSRLNFFSPHRAQLRNHRNLDFQPTQLVPSQGFEPRILQGGSYGALRHGLRQSMIRLYAANAAPQLSTEAQGDKSSSRPSQASFGRGQIGEHLGADRLDDSSPRPGQERAPIFVGELQLRV